MGQVPNYAIIGAGRMARHFCHYLSQLGIPYRQWSRTSNTPLAAVIADCNPILILINDGAIPSFIENHSELQHKTLIHFSGLLVSPQAFSAHPLMSFSEVLYSLETYLKTPFIIEQSGPSFQELLPGLTNPHYALPSNLKAFYHSLCVLSGNFTTLLWQKFFNELETTFQIPKEVAYPYLQQICLNLQNKQETGLTGPLVRGDQTTIDANLLALSQDPYRKVYEAFLEIYQGRRNHHEYT